MNQILRSVFILIILGLTYNIAYCDDGDSISFEVPKSDIKLLKIRPVFFEMSVRSLPAINYYPNSEKPGEADYKTNKSYNIKLNLPIVLSNKMDVIGQFRYKNEQLHLGNDLVSDEKDIHFDNLGMSVLLKYKFNDTYYVAGHFGGFFKADKLSFESYNSILDYSSSFVLGKNIDFGTIGFGAIVGNSLGRLRIYPLFLFDYQFSESWNLELKLPKEIQLRRIVKPDNFYITGGAELNGASYFISQDIMPGMKDLEYRRAAIDLRIGIEKEIVDFLWIGVDFGITQPIYSALVQSGQPTRNKLVDLSHSFTPYGSISLFLVPPKSLFNKIR